MLFFSRTYASKEPAGLHQPVQRPACFEEDLREEGRANFWNRRSRRRSHRFVSDFICRFFLWSYFSFLQFRALSSSSSCAALAAFLDTKTNICAVDVKLILNVVLVALSLLVHFFSLTCKECDEALEADTFLEDYWDIFILRKLSSHFLILRISRGYNPSQVIKWKIIIAESRAVK
jgi:hypothetical protein